MRPTFAVPVVAALVGTAFPAATPAQDALSDFRSLGPGGGGATFSAVFHNTDPDVFLVGQDIGGVSKTTDGGQTFHHVNQGGISGLDHDAGVYGVPGLFAHPRRDEVFFAATWSGLFRSDDEGETWRRLVRPDAAMAALAFSSTEPGLVVAGTGDWHFADDEGDGLFRSTDDGETFARAAGRGLARRARIGGLAFDPADGGLWAAASGGLFRSTDRGDSFRRVASGFRHDFGQWIGIAGTPESRTFWYVLETLGDDDRPDATWSGGVYVSHDGVAFTEVAGLPRVDPVCEEILRAKGAAIDPADPDVLYLDLRTEGGCGGLYRTDGSGWTDLLAGFVNPTYSFPNWLVAPEGVAVAPSRPRRIVSLNEIAVLLSNDGGATWRAATSTRPGPGRFAGTGAEVTAVYDLEISQGVLYAAFEDVGTWASDDRGESFRRISWEVGESGVDGGSEIHAHPDDASRLYVAAGSWSNGIREESVASEILKSTDGGRTVRRVTPPAAPPRGRAAMAVVWGATPAEDTLYVAYHGRSLHKSSDGGVHWRPFTNGFAGNDRNLVFRLAVDPRDPETLYAGLHTEFGAYGTRGGVYRSTDGGGSWQRLAAYPYQDVVALRFAGDPPRLFAGGFSTTPEEDVDGALLVSDDGGATWTPALAQPQVFDVIDAPGSPGVLYAAAGATYHATAGALRAGLYRSTDNGDSFTRVPGELPHNWVHALAIFPDQPDRVLMATNGDGIVAATLPGDGGDGGCTASSTVLCLAGGRFRVEVDWRDFTGRRGAGQVVQASSDDSGLFWFFAADNWEMLVKVLDGCNVNGRFWVFAAATTNVEYTLRVVDTRTGAERRYPNPLGRAAPALTDTSAFATCPCGRSEGAPDTARRAASARASHGDGRPSPAGGQGDDAP